VQVEVGQLEQAKLEVRLKAAQRAAKKATGAGSSGRSGGKQAGRDGSGEPERELQQVEAEASRLRWVCPKGQQSAWSTKLAK
jgi:hypothetical protein